MIKYLKFFIIIAVIFFSACLQDSTALLKQDFKVKKDVKVSFKPGFLILADGNFDQNVFEDYLKRKQEKYVIMIKSFEDVKRWCYPNYPDKSIVNENCDVKAVPVLAGNVKDAALIRKEDLKNYCNSNDLVNGEDYCFSADPSIFRSYFYNLNFEFFNNNLKNVMVVAEHEKVLPVVFGDWGRTYLYYSDISEDPYSKGKIHDWDRNENGILGELYVESMKAPIKSDIYEKAYNTLLGAYEDAFYEKCDSLTDNACDDIDASLYLPEINFGILPFNLNIKDTRNYLKDFLNNSSNVDVSMDGSQKKALFAAVSTFIPHDTWIPADKSSSIWENSNNFKSWELYGDGVLNKENYAGIPPKPNCGYLPFDKNKCWLDMNFDLAMLNTHGTQLLLYDILNIGEIKAEVNNIPLKTIYSSLACLNLSIAKVPISPNYSLEVFEKNNKLDQILLINSSSWGSEIDKFSVRNEEIVYNTMIDTAALPKIYSKSDFDKDGFEDLIMLDENYFSFLSFKNDLKQNSYLKSLTGELWWARSNLFDVDFDEFPEVLELGDDNEKDQGFLMLRSYDKNNFTWNSEKLILPTRKPFYLYSLGSDSNNKYFLISSNLGGGKVYDPFSLLISRQDGSFVIKEVLNPDKLNSIRSYDNFKLLDNGYFVIGDFKSYYLMRLTEKEEIEFIKEMEIKGRNAVAFNLNNDEFIDFVTITGDGDSLNIYSGSDNDWNLDSNFVLSYKFFSLESADINGDGFSDIIGLGFNENNFYPTIYYSINEFGKFNDWKNVDSGSFFRPENKLYDNLGYRLLRLNKGRAFVGAVNYTIPSERSALLVATEFTKSLKSGLSVG